MTTNHPNISREVRAGALAALQALQQVNSLFERYGATVDLEVTPQEGLHAEIDYRQCVVAAVLAAAGELPPHAHGFVSALAEYIEFALRIGEPNLDYWKPDAAMTAREINQSRAETLADMLVN